LDLLLAFFISKKETFIMKKIFISLLIIGVASGIASSTAYARNTVQDFSVKEALSNSKISSAIGDDVQFYFGSSKHKKVSKSFGEYRSNKKTNAFGKSDKTACEWAFASAMVSLRKRALKEGGNAVINIKSNYKDHLTTSNTTFQCGAGAVMAGVALVGTVVKIDK
jgi:hypothetical protein